MTHLGILAATAGAWIVLSALGTVGFSFAANKLKRARPTYTNFIVKLPPVPPPVDPLDELMDELPWECLSPAEITRRCERLWVGL